MFRMHLKSILACSLMAAMFAGCGGTAELAVDQPEGDEGEEELTGDVATWTALVYGAFDTHDSGGIPSSLWEMSQKVTRNSAKVNLLYLEDGPDEPNTKLYKVTARHVEVIKDYGELHTGKPETLASVLKLVREKYPSKYFFLDLIGHTSSAVAAFLPDYTPKAAAWEDQRMAYWQVRQAVLEGAGKVDLLALSGCGTGELEIAARMSDVAGFVVGLQEYSMGYTDVRWAASLISNPNIEPRSLARRVAEGQFKKGYYEQKAPGALGAYDSSKVPAMKAAFTELCSAMNSAVADQFDEILRARANALEMKSSGFEFLVDAYDFAKQLEATTTNANVKVKAGAFVAALTSMLTAGGAPTYADPEQHQNAHGINLVFPERDQAGRVTDPSDFDEELSAWPSEQTSFYEETGWVKLMSAVRACEHGFCPANPRLSIEVDFIGYQRFEPGTIDLLKNYFSSIGYELNIEEGDKLQPVEVAEYGERSKALKAYYTKNFGHKGQAGWHYMLMADVLANGSRGWGMLGGDTFIISASMQESYPTERAKAQAHMILHELGHNLTLTHEGFEPEKSAGTHTRDTCASAAFPAQPVPATFYSPACVAHINLNSRRLVP